MKNLILSAIAFGFTGVIASGAYALDNPGGNPPVGELLDAANQALAQGQPSMAQLDLERVQTSLQKSGMMQSPQEALVSGALNAIHHHDSVDARRDIAMAQQASAPQPAAMQEMPHGSPATASNFATPSRALDTSASTPRYWEPSGMN